MVCYISGRGMQASLGGGWCDCCEGKYCSTVLGPVHSKPRRGVLHLDGRIKAGPAIAYRDEVAHGGRWGKGRSV